MSANWLPTYTPDQLQEAFDKRISDLKIYKYLPHLKLSLLDQQSTINEINQCPSIGSIKIPYFDLDLNPIDFFRYRLLNYQGKNKYIQKGLGTKVYLPPLIESWRDLLRDKNTPLVITEGEFKAIVATAHGVPTLALGGVFSFTSHLDRHKGHNLIPLFNHLPPNKDVYIAFDYDGTGTGEPKEQVKHAEYTLAALLAQRGVNVKLIRLGQQGGKEKIGLDDYILSGKDIELAMKGAIEISSIKESNAIKILSRYANFHGDVLDLQKGKILPIAKFKSHISDQTIGDKSAFAIYSSSKYRLSIDSITFNPTEEAIIDDKNNFNTWRGWGTVPVSGNIELWEEFESMFFQDEPEMQRWFDLWVASYFQKPWHKQYRIPILRSRKTGTGKSTFFETVAYIANGGTKHEVTPSIFHPALITEGNYLGKNFNSFFEGKNLIIFNEAGERGAKNTNLLKDLATAPYLTIERKFQDAYHIPNYVNLVITTNEQYTHIVEEDGRRELVYAIEKEETIEQLKNFFQTSGFHDWAWSKEGREAILNHYMNYPLGDYTGIEPAPKSKGKSVMSSAAMDPVTEYFKEELAETFVVIPKVEYDKFVVWAGTTRLDYPRFKSKLQDLGFDYHKNASVVKQINLTCHGLKKIIVMGRKGLAETDDYADIAAKIKERYSGEKL